MPVAVTNGVLVSVESQYVPARSSPDHQEFFFAYTVLITNTGTETVQLLSRHWIIEDANGKIEQVRGPGVVGKQPILEPGQTFQYTSACPLTTAYGSMRGSYQMQRNDGSMFDARIPEFELAVPSQSRSKLLN
jgi:ApaG protein